MTQSAPLAPTPIDRAVPGRRVKSTCANDCLDTKRQRQKIAAAKRIGRSEFADRYLTCMACSFVWVSYELVEWRWIWRSALLAGMCRACRKPVRCRSRKMVLRERRFHWLAADCA